LTAGSFRYNERGWPGRARPLFVCTRLLEMLMKDRRRSGSEPHGWSRRSGTLCFLAALLPLLAGGCLHRESPKLFVVGLDGATWDLLEPWIQAGDLPNLKAFRDGAAWGTMNSVIPCLSPPAWTSAVTGVNPGRHGIFDFQRRLPNQNIIVTETSKSRRSPPIWNLLKGTGKRVAIMNIPMTDPPDEVDGVMIAGFPHLDQTGYAWPPELEKECKKIGYILDKMEMKIPDGEEQQIFDEIRLARDKRWEIARKLYSEADYDLFWLTFTGTDRVQHMFWKFTDPENPHYDPAKAARFGNCMRQYWIEQDKILGQVFAMIRPGTWILVLSDHGFGPIRHEIRVGNWLHTPQAGISEEEANSVFPLDRSYGANLYIREPGRDPAGTLNPQQRALLRDKLASGLASFLDTGSKPIEAVYTAEQAFVGKYAEKGPILNVMPSYAWYADWGDQDTGYKLPCCGDVTLTLSGWHRMNGMYVLRGPAVKPGHSDASFDLRDVAPTCMYLLGRPLPEDFEGKVMKPVLTDSYLSRHAIVFKGRLSEEDRPLSPEEEKSLKNLPYVGG
jgi:predicted AlkP superfamily phosphohydrolase/phosphomutase